MVYVALLRGINVGGNMCVEMSRLKAVFENLGFECVKTFINSGNVIFSTLEINRQEIVSNIERAIANEFNLNIVVVIRSIDDINNLINKIPANWTNDAIAKTDVLFLWDTFDKPTILKELTIKPDLETVFYHPGTIVWHVLKTNISKSSLLKIIGTPLYKNVTIRNINTVRKIQLLMKST